MKFNLAFVLGLVLILGSFGASVAQAATVKEGFRVLDYVERPLPAQPFVTAPIPAQVRAAQLVLFGRVLERLTGTQVSLLDVTTFHTPKTGLLLVCGGAAFDGQVTIFLMQTDRAGANVLVVDPTDAQYNYAGCQRGGGQHLLSKADLR